MIAPYDCAYIDRTQLIIRHLQELMIAWYKCCTVISSAGVGAIYKFKLWGHLFRRKCNVSFNVNVIKMLKSIFASLAKVSL